MSEVPLQVRPGVGQVFVFEGEAVSYEREAFSYERGTSAGSTVWWAGCFL